MQLTLNDLYNNPTGHGSAQVASRTLIRQMLEKKFLDLVNKKKFNLMIFEKDYNEGLVYLIKVPSEQDTKIIHYHDVVIELNTKTDESKINLFDYPVKFFSNSPAFIYTYSNFALQNDLIPIFLKDKFNKEAKQKKALVRNPTDEMGFEKSIFFAVSYIKYKKYHLKGNIKKISRPFRSSAVFEQVISFDKQLIKYKAFEEKINKEKKNEKEKKSSKVVYKKFKKVNIEKRTPTKTGFKQIKVAKKLVKTKPNQNITIKK